MKLKTFFSFDKNLVKHKKRLVKQRILWLGLLTLLGFPFVGFLLLYFFDPQADYLEFTFSSAYTLYTQAGIGLITGGIMGFFARWFIERPWLQSSTSKYERIFKEMQLNFPAIIFLSIAAGVGEELLFRVAIQHFLGVEITAILFVAIHGYLDPRDWKISIYGLILTGFIILLGYFRIHFGIFSAIIAHSFYDFILFNYYLQKKN